MGRVQRMLVGEGQAEAEGIGPGGEIVSSWHEADIPPQGRDFRF
jgi:hypothetical protein